MIYFSSDLHLGHDNIIKYTNRPFKDHIEMDKTIINNFNSIVTNKDILYLLGDMCFKNNKHEMVALLNKINAQKKILIRGNHDIKFIEQCFDAVYDYHEIQYNKRRIVLFHYPIVDNEWNGGYGHGSSSGTKNKKNASIHLHGHIHSQGPHYNRTNRNKDVFKYDVGIDANNYKPVSIDEIFKFFRLGD